MVLIDEVIPACKKRKAPPDNFDFLAETPPHKMPSDHRKVDHYCWVCHEIGEDIVCSSCPRAYHVQCLKRSKHFNSSGLCPECQITSVDETEPRFQMSSDMLTRLLKHALDRMLSNEVMGILNSWPITKENERLHHILDLSKLTDKLNDEIIQYTKTAEFYSDVKWIFHNCVIVYGHNHPTTASAKRVIRKMRDELRNIEACPECYERANSNDVQFFVKVCNTKHPLVWAKLKGYPYWPAKCLRVTNGVADVRFFKTHDKGNIKVNQCYLLSHENPKGNPKNFDYKEAVQELKKYLQNWEKKFGKFKYAPICTVFDPKMMENANFETTQNRKYKRRRLAANQTKTVIEQSNRAVSEIMCDSNEVEKLKKASKTWSDRSDAATMECLNMEHPRIDMTANETTLDETVEPSGTVSVCMTFSTDDDDPRCERESFSLADHSLLVQPSLAEMEHALAVVSSTKGGSCRNLVPMTTEAFPDGTELGASSTNATPNSPIRIVESSTILVSETEVICIEDSPQRAEENSDVQIWESTGNKNSIIPNQGSCRRNATISAHETELSSICSEASSFMRTLISRVWAIGHKHKSANEIQNLLNGMDTTFRRREEAMLRRHTQKERDYEARLLKAKKVIEDLQKTIHDTDLILMSTREELASAEARLEITQKEWQVQKEGEINQMRDYFSKEVSKMKQSWTHKEKTMSVRVRIKEKKMEEEMLRKIDVKTKELEQEMKKKIAKKEKEFENELIKQLEMKEKSFETALKTKLTEVKRKEWCANCSVEAKFRCCWNTHYCGPTCQRAHWREHVQFCETVSSSRPVHPDTTQQVPPGAAQQETIQQG